MSLISYERQLDSINQNIDLAISMIANVMHDPLNMESYLQNVVSILQHQKATIEMFFDEIDMMWSEPTNHKE